MSFFLFYLYLYLISFALVTLAFGNRTEYPLFDHKITVFFLGKITLDRVSLLEDSNKDIAEEYDLGEPPPNDLIEHLIHNRKRFNKTNFQSEKKFSCHICDPPNCNNPSTCFNAIQCWKSRVREQNGK